MPEPPEMVRNELARKSLRKAEQDLTLLAKIFADSDVSREIVGFHAQQAMEKALKAVLYAKGVPFRRTPELHL